MTRKEKLWLGGLLVLGAGVLIAGLTIDRLTKNYLFVDHASNGQLEEARQLLADGANVDAREYGCTALYAAAGRGHTDVVALLLEHGADPRLLCDEKIARAMGMGTRGYRGRTPLHVARNGEIARMLIDHGADVNAIDGEGFTPVHRAIERGDVALVELMFEHGGTLPRKWKRYHAPLFLAVNGGHREMVAYLREHGYEWDAIMETLVERAGYPSALARWEGGGLDPAIAAELPALNQEALAKP